MATLDGLFADTANVQAIHYSCESFYDRPEGQSPRITSISIRLLDSGQTHLCSIHQVAEREDVAFNHISRCYDKLEKQLLEEFFDYVGQRQGTKYLHWNMHDINHGFSAVEHRFRVPGGQPVIIDNKNKFDLARLLIDTYGTCYIGHTRLEKLMPRNSKLAPHFLTGAKEAKALKDRGYVRLRQSTLRKVELLASFATWAQHRSLKTDTTWWQMHGGRVRLTIEWVACHWLLSVLSVLITIIGGLYVIVHRMV